MILKVNAFSAVTFPSAGAKDFLDMLRRNRSQKRLFGWSFHLRHGYISYLL